MKKYKPEVSDTFEKKGLYTGPLEILYQPSFCCYLDMHCHCIIKKLDK